MSTVVFIGRQPIPIYVATTFLALKRSDWVVLRARGKAIYKAVTVAEIAKHNYKARITDVKIGTELVGEGEKAKHVSYIEIQLLGTGA